MGQKIRGTDFIGPPKPGRTLAIIGDTRPTANAVALARGVDVLVHEATYRADQEGTGGGVSSLASVQAAETAREAGVGVLILTHISARYGAEEGGEYLAETRKIFPNTYLAHDFWSYPVLR